MALAIFALGSNVGDRLQHLQRAVDALAPMLQGLRCSRIYESRAVTPPGAPPEWDTPFLNMTLCGQTELPPQALLEAVKILEAALGRQARGHWGPREIDIDILAVDDIIMDTPALTLPHPRLTERAFVLYPLQDILPSWKYPAGGEYNCYTPSDLISAKNMLYSNDFALTEYHIGVS